MNKFTKKIEIALHPTRIRIITALVDKNLTTQELGEILTNIPTATLYRHLSKLVEYELIQVVEERQVRGTLEKVYALKQNDTNLAPEDLSNEAIMELFTSFVLSVLGDFGRYLNQAEKPDLIKDGVSFTKAPLYLNDEEYKEFLMAFAPVVMQRLENRPEPGRRYRLLTTIIMPGVDSGNGKE
jgi:DNA-binding transcriptional ArsR family regulator